MKLSYSLVLAILFSLNMYAQDTITAPSHYVFSEFTMGQVLLQNGVKNVVSLNYNALSEEMVFNTNGVKLAIADEQLKTIDTVFIGERKFLHLENTFLELLENTTFELYVEYKCRMKYPGKVNGPGGRTSQTSSSETYAPKGFQQAIYEVKLPTGYDATPYQYYWLKQESELKRFKNLNQLAKLYPSKKSQFKAYTKKHDVNFNNKENIIKLVSHLEAK